jgi:hypothetical protein
MLKKFQHMHHLFASNPVFATFGGAKQFWIKSKFLMSRIFRRTALIDYVQYFYFLRTREGQRQFIDTPGKRRLIATINNDEKYDIFDSKVLFNEHFAPFIHRRWMDMKTADREAFHAFTQGRDAVFAKPTRGTYGIGIERISLIDEDPDEVFERFAGRAYVLEEAIASCEALSRLNPSSLNTVRVVTITLDRTVHIIGAALRIGRAGSVVDNNHSGGLSALVDIETGIVFTPATNQNYERHVVHPDNGHPIVGFTIPCWQKIVSAVRDAALIHDDVGYVGWDVAVNDRDEVVLIEGNYNADPDVLQRADQHGKWPMVQAVLDEHGVIL